MSSFPRTTSAPNIAFKNINDSLLIDNNPDHYERNYTKNWKNSSCITIQHNLNLLSPMSWLTKIDTIFFTCGIPTHLLTSLDNVNENEIRLYFKNSHIKNMVKIIISPYILSLSNNKIKVL